jgi:hypothetical protein
MKYFITIFVTAVIVFLGATIYYKGLPSFPQISKNVVSTESGNVSTKEVLEMPVATASATPDSTDSASIIKAIKLALVKKHGPNAENMVVTVSKVEGEYAKGMANEEGGGGLWFAARQNGFWTLVWDGNGQIDCTDISPFPGFPKSMIPECWDKTLDKLVTR